METPDFINTTLSDIQSVFLGHYEQAILDITGVARKVQPAQAEMLMINSGAYMIYLAYLKMQDTALKNLTQFATYPVLDAKAQDFGVYRIPAQPASCKARLTFSAGHPDLVMPAGMRVQSDDGAATFFTTASTAVPAGTTFVDVSIICDTPGIIGNNYTIGKINAILDPQAYLSAASNIDIPMDGVDIESDEGLRSRLYLAPNAFSVAGSNDAYKFLAGSASSLILDVAINNGNGGLVNIYPLVAGGTTPQTILDKVEAACNPKNKRPTSDLVHAISPTVVNYTVDLSLIVYGSVADPATLVANATAAVLELTNGNSKRIGIDTPQSQIIAAASLPGVYKVIPNAPLSDIIVGNTEVGICTSVNITLTGFNYER